MANAIVNRLRTLSSEVEAANRCECAAEYAPVGGHFIEQTPFSLRGGPFPPRIEPTIRKYEHRVNAKFSVCDDRLIRDPLRKTKGERHARLLHWRLSRVPAQFPARRMSSRPM